ncbi:FHA domain-containing protein [Kineobactrum salinum]|uniref:FHA domain-containing protein n=1 Tax=Kineobactrum salinum TaxID=2708301 RepID=A0A6C0U8Z3_9GAMM|nr:FHA domain-containing protein [Kineobactrum salinum]QIB66054.1 FHA domain-containing protein [Kineobactrum salinum]
MPAAGRSHLKTFYRELRRRKVFQTCFYYLLLCWGGLQAIDILFPLFDLDADLVSRYLFALAILGFPVAFTLAWFFQITREGVARSTPFSERRVLDNIPPINDRRRNGARGYFRKPGGPRSAVHDWTLSAETGPLAGLSFSITRSLVMGRSLDSDIAVVSPHVSRQHARLTLEGDMLSLEDLGSANGTMVNGRPLTGRCTLYNEDEIRFHDIVFRVTRSYASAGRGTAALDQTTYIEPLHSNSTPTKPTDRQ